MKTGDLIHGFRVLKTTELSEIRATACEMVYEKNGAKLLYFDRDDANKSFAIAFKTIPDDDTGVFHILEHSVLNGSAKYPVKEPFVELLKGSLNTFLNAFTYNDKTVYPVSSRSDRDFLNLVDVYMDAVLHPAILHKPEIFMQEGWHFELPAKDAEMTYKGVVFNEMKGAYSSADEVASEELAKLLFPDNCYSRDSGGDPLAIPSLTYEKFLACHKKFYHPSNARILLDGRMDLDEVLAKLDSFLAPYDALDCNFDIPLQKPIGFVKKERAFEIAPGDDPEGKCRVYLGYVVTRFDELERSLALSVLAEVLAGSNDAPFKRAMLDSGLCEDASISAGGDSAEQNLLVIELRNVKRENLDTVAAFALETLEKILAEGVDKERLTAYFNRFEFTTRERDFGSFPKGLVYELSALDTWLYGGDPLAGFFLDPIFSSLREKLGTRYFEELLEELVLHSKHAARLDMIPSATLGEERLAEEKARLAKARAAMSGAEIDALVKTNEKLVAWQKTDDTPEDLAKLPRLTVDDVPTEPVLFPTEEATVLGAPVLFHAIPSEGIVYTELYFDASGLSLDELAKLSLASALLVDVATEKHSPEKLQTLVKANLGGFSASVTAVTKNGAVRPYLKVFASALASKKADLSALVSEILLSSKFEDEKTLRKVVRQQKIGGEQSLTEGGHSAAIGRAFAGVSAQGAISEATSGYDFYCLMKKIDADFDGMAPALEKELARVLAAVVCRERLTLGVTSTERDEAFERDLVSRFPEAKKPVPVCDIQPFGIRREGILIPAQISFAGMVGNFFSLGERETGAMLVARTILSYEYLWNAVRVQGGAYGVGCILSPAGMTGFYSYRDPDAHRSVGCFAECGNFLRGIAKSGQDLLRFVIGAVGDADPLYSPNTAGSTATLRILRGTTAEDLRALRREMIAVTPEDLLKVADFFDRAAKGSSLCIVGGKDKLDAFGDTLDATLTV